MEPNKLELHVEAVRRMKILGLPELCCSGLPKGIIGVSDLKNNIVFADDDMKNQILSVQKQWGVFVYHVVVTDDLFINMLCLSSCQENWNDEIQELIHIHNGDKRFDTLTFVKNLVEPEQSFLRFVRYKNVGNKLIRAF